MGAEAFIHLVKAASPCEAFNKLVQKADRDYGTRSYNGSINTCSMGRCKQRYDKPSETNKKAASKYIESVSYGEKYVADYIDLGVCEYQAVTMKKVNTQGEAATIRVKYVVRERDYNGVGKFIKPFDTKKEADDYALSLAMKNQKPYDIFKEGVVISGSTKTSSIELEVKSYNSKPSLKAMPNRYIVEIHEYMFYGWASS